MFLFSILFVAAHTIWTPSRAIEGDPLQYLRLAHSIVDHQVFAYKVEEARPGGLAPREPLYPTLLAGVLYLEKALGFKVACSNAQGDDCGEGLPLFTTLNAALFAIGAIATGAAVLSLGAPTWAGWFAFTYVLLNFQAASEIEWVMSDYLAMAMAAMFSLAAARALRSNRPALWVLPGIAAALLTLTKVAFLYFAVSGLVFLALTGLLLLWRSGSKRILTIALALAIGYLPLVGAWSVRNGVVLGQYCLTEGRGSETLGLRVAFNDLTPKQFVAGVFWWTRGFGDALAKRLFDEEAQSPFDWSQPNNHYEVSVAAIHRRVKEASAASQGDERAGEKTVTDELVREAISQPLQHATSTLLFIYRGIWIDEFIVLGLPLLMFAVVHAVRRRQWELLIVLSPGLFGMLFYALLSLNPPRYQLTSLPTIAIGAALGAAYLAAKWRERRLRPVSFVRDHRYIAPAVLAE
jgi:hypothetical protein